MTAKKFDLDNKLRNLVESCSKFNHRSLLFINCNAKKLKTTFEIDVDDAGEKIMVIHILLSRYSTERPSILWCHNEDSSTPKLSKKALKHIEKKINAGNCDISTENAFHLFLLSTKVKFCSYNNTSSILGNTYNMCVIQDFDGLTPNTICRITETVSGGGIIVFLLPGINSLRDLFSIPMKVHSKLVTHSHQNVDPHFNERFILSLAKCKSCLILDKNLRLHEELANQKSLAKVTSMDSADIEEGALNELMESLNDANKPLPQLCALCCTVDQAKAVLKMVDVLTEKSGRSTVSITAGRGRGKSAALGLAVAAAVYFGTNNIYVVSPSPENLTSFFEFLFKGFDALDYVEEKHYDIIQSTNPNFNNAIVRVNVFARHRQVIQYLCPTDHKKAALAELVVIDEAASIPLANVKSLLGLYNVFMASTIEGYEGTGRSLSLKLLKELREQSVIFGAKATSGSSEEAAQSNCRPLAEVSLERSIRYSPNDPVEKWLIDVFCLDATSSVLIPDTCPPPSECSLYYVNKDILMSGHRDTDKFLHQVTSLLVSSHYRNSPDDLQILSDAPAHHLFVLLPPLPSDRSSALPAVFCVIQICIEGSIPVSVSSPTLNRGERPTGDLIPWTIAQQFFDPEFTEKAGARFIRVATHPDYQSMGYGSRAVSLVVEYFQKRHISLVDTPMTSNQPNDDTKEDNSIAPRKSTKPLLMSLREREPESVDYLGVSYGLTGPLYKFWNSSHFVPLYISLTSNKITGEYNCIMVHPITTDNSEQESDFSLPPWIQNPVQDFGCRFSSLLGAQFSSLHCKLAFNIVSSASSILEENELSWNELEKRIDGHDLKRLESYAKNMSDHHLITDLLPNLAYFYFNKCLPSVHLSTMQSCLLVGCGYQFKTIETVTKEIDLPIESSLGQFNRMIRRLLSGLSERQENAVSLTLPFDAKREVKTFKPVAISLDDDLANTAEDYEMNLSKKAKMKLKQFGDLSDFKIKGDDEVWNEAMTDNSIQERVSIKTHQKPQRLSDKVFQKELEGPENKKMKTSNKKKTPRSSNGKFIKRRK